MFSKEEYISIREAVAREHGITLYKQYSEPQAAHFLDVDLSTLKRWRRAGMVPFVNMGQRQLRYFGFMVCDIMILGADKCLNTPVGNSNLENGGLVKTENPPLGSAHGMTKEPVKLDVQALGQRITKKPS